MYVQNKQWLTSLKTNLPRKVRVTVRDGRRPHRLRARTASAACRAGRLTVCPAVGLVHAGGGKGGERGAEAGNGAIAGPGEGAAAVAEGGDVARRAVLEAGRGLARNLQEDKGEKEDRERYH